MEIPYFVISAKYEPLKCTFKFIFQIWTLPDIKMLFGHNFLSFGCDTHFKNSEYLSQVVHKIKLAKKHSHLEKAYFKYACDVSFFCSVYIYV